MSEINPEGWCNGCGDYNFKPTVNIPNHSDFVASINLCESCLKKALKKFKS